MLVLKAQFQEALLLLGQKLGSGVAIGQQPVQRQSNDDSCYAFEDKDPFSPGNVSCLQTCDWGSNLPLPAPDIPNSVHVLDSIS